MCAEYFSDTQRSCSLIWSIISGSPYCSVFIHVNWSKYKQLLVMWDNGYSFNALFLKQKEGSICQNIWSWHQRTKITLSIARYTRYRYWISNPRQCKLKLRRKYSHFNATETQLTELKNCYWSRSPPSVYSPKYPEWYLTWTRGWTTRISPFSFYFFSLVLKCLNVTIDAAHFHLFFEAEKHAGVSCVTASVDDIQFEERAR